MSLQTGTKLGRYEIEVAALSPEPQARFVDLLPKRLVNAPMDQQEQGRREPHGSFRDEPGAFSLGSRIELQVAGTQDDHDY